MISNDRRTPTDLKSMEKSLRLERSNARRSCNGWCLEVYHGCVRRAEAIETIINFETIWNRRKSA